MINLQLIAGVIAFAACFLAIASLSSVNPSRRVKQATSRDRGLINDMFGLDGPQLKQWLSAAGFFHPQASFLYTVIVISAALIGGIAGGLAAIWIELPPVGSLLFVFAGAFVLSRLPSGWINRQWQQRSEQIAESLPLMLDMMEVSTNSGRSLDQSWTAVEGQMRGVCPPLAEEMELVELECKLGRTRQKAIFSMAERTGVGDVAALASMLEQSERFGSGLADTFSAQAKSMRKDFVYALEERANRSSVLAILPVVLLMLPAIFLVTIVPMTVVIVRALNTEMF